MASKLWEKNTEVNQEIEKFTVGRDRELDLYLARYDVLGSMAHITMLESIGLLGKDEAAGAAGRTAPYPCRHRSRTLHHRRGRGRRALASGTAPHP